MFVCLLNSEVSFQFSPSSFSLSFSLSLRESKRKRKEKVLCVRVGARVSGSERGRDGNRTETAQGYAPEELASQNPPSFCHCCRGFFFFFFFGGFEFGFGLKFDLFVLF